MPTAAAGPSLRLDGPLAGPEKPGLRLGAAAFAEDTGLVTLAALASSPLQRQPLRIAEQRRAPGTIAASSGLGAAVARQFGRRGVDAALIVRNLPEPTPWQPIASEGMTARGFAADYAIAEP